MSDDIDIKGGAGPAETAAILAIIAQLVDEARIAASRPVLAPHQTAWVQTGRLRDNRNPVTTRAYDARPWITSAVLDDGG